MRRHHPLRKDAGEHIITETAELASWHFSTLWPDSDDSSCSLWIRQWSVLISSLLYLFSDPCRQSLKQNILTWIYTTEQYRVIHNFGVGGCGTWSWKLQKCALSFSPHKWKHGRPIFNCREWFFSPIFFKKRSSRVWLDEEHLLALILNWM